MYDDENLPLDLTISVARIGCGPQFCQSIILPTSRFPTLKGLYQKRSSGCNKKVLDTVVENWFVHFSISNVCTFLDLQKISPPHIIIPMTITNTNTNFGYVSAIR